MPIRGRYKSIRALCGISDHLSLMPSDQDSDIIPLIAFLAAAAGNVPLSLPQLLVPRTPNMRAPTALLRRLASRIRNVARRLWLLPETRPVVAGDTICLAINVAELIFAAARPCVMSSMLYDETCGNSLLILQIVSIVKVTLVMSLVQYCTLPRFALAYTYAGLKFPLGNELKQVPTRGWAAASSAEVFQEIVRVRRLRTLFPCPAS